MEMFLGGPITTNKALNVMAETRVRISTVEGSTALETTSPQHLLDSNIHIGIDEAYAYDLGQLKDSPKLNHQATFEIAEVGNTRSGNLRFLKEEKTTFSVTPYGLNPYLFRDAVGSGAIELIGTNDSEVLLPFGGGCSSESRAIEAYVTNLSCYIPVAGTPVIDGANNEILNGWTYCVTTLYETYMTSALDWEMKATEFNTITLEYDVRDDLAKTNGKRRGNIYFAN